MSTLFEVSIGHRCSSPASWRAVVYDLAPGAPAHKVRIEKNGKHVCDALYKPNCRTLHATRSTPQAAFDWIEAKIRAGFAQRAATEAAAETALSVARERARYIALHNPKRATEVCTCGCIGAVHGGVIMAGPCEDCSRGCERFTWDANANG